MATLSRIATLRLDDAATHATNILQWVATAAVEQTAEGGAVVITTVRTTAGVPPGNPNTLTLSIYDQAAALVRAFTLNVTDASQTSTFFFTDTGATGGAARHGTYEIAIRATRTDIGTYDVETDATPNTPPATFDSHLDRGYIIGTTTKAHAFSNVAAGGAKNQPAEYDESLFLRVTLGSPSAVAQALAVTLSAGSLSGNTNSTTSATRDISFANVADDRFPAAVTTVTATVTAPNATLTGLPYTVFTATTADSIDVDPRLTASHHFQVDDNTFATAKNDTSKAMLSTQSGFLATRFVTARTATGVNGLTVTQTLTPVQPGTAVSASSATATRDTQAGWTDLLPWPSSKSGGTWNKTTDITAPADIDADTHVLTGTDAYILLAPDPRVSVMVAYGPTTASEDNHLQAGDDTAISVTAFSRDTGKRLAPDTGTVTARIIRWNRTAARFEYLATNGVTWTAWTGTTVVAATHALTDAGDTVTFTKTLTTTAGWGATDIVAVQVQFKLAGTPYGFYIGRELTGAFNLHSLGDAVTPADIASIANAVWDETTAEARVAGSYGQVVRTNLDVAVSTRATPDQTVHGEVGP